jgi:hypothetical protein
MYFNVFERLNEEVRRHAPRLFSPIMKEMKEVGGATAREEGIEEVTVAPDVKLRTVNTRQFRSLDRQHRWQTVNGVTHGVAVRQ